MSFHVGYCSLFFCFVDYIYQSVKGFIDWAKQQIENYAEMFRKQVYISDVEPKTVKEALQITYSQSKKVYLMSISLHDHVSYLFSSCSKSMVSTFASSLTNSLLRTPKIKRKHR